MDYARINELILKNGEPLDEDALNEVVKEFWPVIYCKAKRIKRLYIYAYIDEGDLIQEGIIALIEAIYSYCEFYDAKFTTFALTCIDNKMYSALKRANRKKHKHLNNALSYDCTFYNDLPIIECLKDERVKNPYEEISEAEAYANLLKRIEKELSQFEIEVFRYKAEGYNYIEIAKLMNKDIKQIDNALQRIRKKVMVNLKS